VWIDAKYVKVRNAGRIVSVAVIIAVGVNSDGAREVLGMATGPSEAEPFWTDVLRGLTRRGLRGVKHGGQAGGRRWKASFRGCVPQPLNSRRSAIRTAGGPVRPLARGRQRDRSLASSHNALVVASVSVFAKPLATNDCRYPRIQAISGNTRFALESRNVPTSAGALDAVVMGP
jgi:hypothetical protein